MPRSMAFIAALLIGSTPLRAEITRVDVAWLEQLPEKEVPVVDLRTPEEWSRPGVIEGRHRLTFADARRRQCGSGPSHLAHADAATTPDGAGRTRNLRHGRRRT